MTEFYSSLKKGNRKDAALRNAKIQYLQNTVAPELTHPYYWACFVANGDTDSIDLVDNKTMHYVLLAMVAFVVILVASMRRLGR